MKACYYGCEVDTTFIKRQFARIWTFTQRRECVRYRAVQGCRPTSMAHDSRVPVGIYKIGLIAEERKPHLTNKVIGDPRIHNQEWAKQKGIADFGGYP